MTYVGFFAVLVSRAKVLGGVGMRGTHRGCSTAGPFVRLAPVPLEI